MWIWVSSPPAPFLFLDVLLLRCQEWRLIPHTPLCADSPFPPLNPYFLLRDKWCSGVWSDVIIAELNQSRPNAHFEELSESFGEVGYRKDGRMTISPEFPKSRAMSLKLSNYALLSAGMSIS